MFFLPLGSLVSPSSAWSACCVVVDGCAPVASAPSLLGGNTIKNLARSNGPLPPCPVSNANAQQNMFDVAKADEEPAQTRGDLFFSKHTATAARLSAGCATEAAAAVASGRLSRAFAVVRPPGHHAECQRAMGFCLYNNCAVAAQAALACKGVGRVMILDWDVHHGEPRHYPCAPIPCIRCCAQNVRLPMGCTAAACRATRDAQPRCPSWLLAV